MPANTGTQVVSLIHRSAASSPNVNRRHQDIRQCGIYQGGRLTAVVGLAASLSELVCEISDGTHQVRIQTTAAISLTAVIASPYFVLRWTYTGAASDFMEVLAVAAPLANDLVIGKCVFAGAVLTGFDYGDAAYPRSTPNTQDLFLKVESTEDTELKVRIRAGRIHNYVGNIDVADQKSDLFTVPTSNSRVDLLYLDKDGNVAIDSSGTPAATPVAPNYNGKLVLAEITLASTSTNITDSMIKNVRNWVALPQSVDDTTIEKSATGALQVKSTGVGLQLRTGTLSGYDFTQADLTQDGNWHDLDLSAIVPAGAIAVKLEIGVLKATLAAETFMVRKNGSLDEYNVGKVSATVDNRGAFGEKTVGVDTNRIIEYKETKSTGVLDVIQIVIKGWYL